MKEAAVVIEALEADTIDRLLDGGTTEVLGEEIGLEDVVVGREPRAGVVVASDERLSVALDTTVTPALAREGTAREIIKLIQGMRRDAGLDVADRIRVVWQTDDDALAAALEEHAGWIAGEVLATEIGAGSAPASAERHVPGGAIRVEIAATGG
jgi:isoleucyl-tRNA synthetase